jgi:hypothetical protein
VCVTKRQNTGSRSKCQVSPIGAPVVKLHRLSGPVLYCCFFFGPLKLELLKLYSATDNDKKLG